MTRLQAITKRCEGATKGEWSATKRQRKHMGPFEYEFHLGINKVGHTIGEIGEESNAEFIAHSREDIPYLLSEIQRLRGALEFYATKDNYGLGGGNSQIIYSDVGKKAQQALTSEGGV